MPNSPASCCFSADHDIPCLQVIWRIAANVMVLFQMVRLPEVRGAALPLDARHPVDPQAAQVCARAPAELSAAELEEVRAKALELAQ